MHVADEDKRAWDDGEWEASVRDEVGDILLEGGETETTEQTSSLKKPHHQPGAPQFASRAKVAIQSAWVRDWQKSPRRGRYAIANRIRAPSLNPTQHLTALQNQCEVFGRLVQCRTSHAYTGEFRKQFFLEKSVNCECGETLQTHENIIRTCAQYEIQRAKLRDKHPELATPRTHPHSPNSIRPRRTHLHGRKNTSPRDSRYSSTSQNPPDIDSGDGSSNDAEQ